MVLACLVTGSSSCTEAPYINRFFWKTGCESVTQVPDIPSDAQKVLLYKNKISSIMSDSFNHLTQLSTLELHNNVITYIEPSSFSHLGELTELTLGNNRLTEITANMFAGLAKLKILKLRHNSISIIEAGAFSHMPQLQTLDLSNNSLETLPIDAFNMTNNSSLTLDLQGNQMQCDKRLSWLKTGQEDGSIRWLGQNNKPRCINFPQKNWDDVPIPLRVNCEDPRTYCKQNSSSEKVPTDIDPQTTMIAIRNTHIQTLDSNSFTSLTELKIVMLNQNKISSIEPGTFRNQANLIRLDLGYNSLPTFIGENFEGLDSLQILRITGNKITSMGAGAFANLPQINTIQVDITQLTVFWEVILSPSAYPNTPKVPKVTVQDAQVFPCNSSSCWLKILEEKGYKKHYEYNGTVSRPRCSDRPGMFWDQVELDCPSSSAGIY